MTQKKRIKLPPTTYPSHHELMNLIRDILDKKPFALALFHALLRELSPTTIQHIATAIQTYLTSLPDQAVAKP
ncbi:hypothetical protein LCGC14_1669760 [marine sediment metagenome]|uniref:Uncharacterized protein n=1 Tax=marine sediment metagenome TaxID=412755 RepID=A0A0F9HRM6_9ZZZZ